MIVDHEREAVPSWAKVEDSFICESGHDLTLRNTDR